MGLAVGLAFVLRVGFLSNPFWADERITRSFIEGMSFWEILFVLPTVQPHFPLYYAILEVWAHGAALVDARLLSVLAGSLLPAVVFLLGQQHSRTTGLVAALFTSLSPALVHSSWWLRPYAMFALATAVACLALDRGLQTESRRWFTTFVVAALVGVYLHPFGLIALGVWTAWTGVNRAVDGAVSLTLVWIGSLPAIGLMLAKLVLPSSAGSVEQVAHVTTGPSLVQVLVTPVALVFGTLWSEFLLAIGAVVFGLVVLGTWRARGDRLVRLSLLWIGASLVGTVVLSVVHPIYQMKYLLWTVAPVLLLLAVCRCELDQRLRTVFDILVLVGLLSNLFALVTRGLLMANVVSPVWNSVSWF
ncbi:glycosyltransferase family 39 protein [Halogeometricum limi]|uniref:Dolichyl-phosphate-mannose-protein mannosyltransferase n=1 Tax=Halogeometricum limi TaxID=555875 RepID=A0A1I6FWD0_9EURY|nr:glycosyltransferase family 39 protein [Halogeometricum limi]SFR34224.1 Dolichyl-phosphate-mannose-protein mannosyltransferase [Halogeometricum limi]